MLLITRAAPPIMKTTPLIITLASSLITLSTALYAKSEVIIIPTSAPPTTLEQSWWMEASGFYGFAQNDLIEQAGANIDQVDSYGGDLTLGYDLDARNSVNMRFGYGYGSHSQNDLLTTPSKLTAKVHNFELSAGYRYTHPITESISAYLGGQVGVSNESVKLRFSTANGRTNSHDSDYGIYYAAELGMQYHITADCYTFIAYQFQGSSSRPKINYDNISISTKKQGYQTVRIGMGWKI